jgi:hypothetical protein
MREVEVPDGSREHQDVARGLVVPEDELPRHLTLFELDELEELEDPLPPRPPPDDEELELLELEPPLLDEEDEDDAEDDEAADELDDDELDEPAELELDEAVLESEPGALVEELAAASGAAGFASSQAVEASPTASVPPVSNFKNSRRSSRRRSAVSSPPGWSWSFMGSSLGSRRARGRTTLLDPSSPGIDSP